MSRLRTTAAPDRRPPLSALWHRAARRTGLIAVVITVATALAVSASARAVGVAALRPAPAVAASPADSAPTFTPDQHVSVYATYYGWYDNTPPGCRTAYTGCAGGTGTFTDPITFASDTAEFPVGTVLYYPTVEKYFRMGDACQECDLDWSGHGPNGGPHLHHVDLWLGGQGANEFDAIDCEDALTLARPDGAPRLTSFIVDPPSDLRVSAQPLFDTTTGRCFGAARASSTAGSYRNRASRRCLTDPRPAVDARATAGSCAVARASRIIYNGAFLVHDGRCLKTTGPGHGSQIVWSSCDGDAREQWEINPDGTITWVQYTRCVADVRGHVMLTACTGRPSQRWRFHRSA